MRWYDRWLLGRAALRNAFLPSPARDLPPFVQQILQHVIVPSRNTSPQFSSIEALRSSWLKEKTLLSITDLGAGSKIQQSKQRSVASLVRHSSTPPRFSRLLFHLIQFLDGTTVAELGTSVGLNTLYLRQAIPTHGQLYTFEGCPEIAHWATQAFQNQTSLPIHTTIGNLDETWPSFLAEAPALDLVYMDANHQLAPTLAYFEAMLPRLHPHSIVVVDDIYWSREMHQAWSALQTHPQVSLSLDLFEAGLLLLNPDLPQQTFRIRY
ncbi:MAG TPA: SAM-dependent methyltransferase [Cytophagales bacterium]|nr:SAM-dependent methyltransferase [Cytophagales bacterium]HAA17898.1 SAM-dependent methyltransferase [Cytophagales bacterium]HAP58179.1 SAM-dependent methyltransferase [Cytophagales bacterium]